MASSRITLLSTFLLALTTESSAYAPMTLTIVNNCPFTIWPAIQPNVGSVVLECGGFALPTLSHQSFPAPTAPWSGRIWARTGCQNCNGRFYCATGDCGGRLQCQGAGGAPPASLAQIAIHQGEDSVSYGVSLVDGFNVPMTITPHEGRGQCPVVGCKADLVKTCPWQMRFRAVKDGPVVGCGSACQVYPSDENCCRGYYNSPNTCRPTSYSRVFKDACPATYTYAHDTPSMPQNCAAPKELKVIFCH